MTTTKTLNGVDVEKLYGTLDAIKQAPAIAKFQFEADHAWVDGAHNRTTIREFYGACEKQRHARPFVFDHDEPPVLLGSDANANPVEYVLHALAGCLTTAIVFHAAARGIRVRRVEARLQGDLDMRGFLGLSDEVRNGYQGIRVDYSIDADGPDELLQDLVAMAQARSPVFDIVSHPVPVTVTARRATAEASAA
jgi:uncharacterized OsmC-like protein